ncbi:hypothetical protein FA13DRAFT_1724670, partial [Coprinellus micaceus]
MTQPYNKAPAPAPGNMPFPSITPTSRPPTTRKKLQKAPRQRYRTSPKQPFRTVPLTRSPSTRSDNSRGHLLPSDAQNRHVHFARYPARSNQPSVLRKRRNDSAAGRRTYHTFPHAIPGTPRYPTGYVPQHESPDRHNNIGHEPLLQRVPEQEIVPQQPHPELSPLFPEPELSAEHGVLQRPAPLPVHESFSPGQILQHPAQPNSPTTSWAQRRWTMSEPLPSTSAGTGPNSRDPTSSRPRPSSQHLEKALPELPVLALSPTAPSKHVEATASSSKDANRDSHIIPPPLYTEESPLSSTDSPLPPIPPLDTIYHGRLIADFIRDERTYITTLRQSVKNEDIFITSSSEDLVSRVEGDRTLTGVSSAFLGSCRPLETALVKWSEETARTVREGEEAKERREKALPPTPEEGGSSSRRNSLFRRVSVLWGKGKGGRNSSKGGHAPQHKPDRIWQPPANTGTPGLWEMSVLPSQRLTQYRYLLRELLATVPGTHPSYSELDRALHGVVFISEKVAK